MPGERAIYADKCASCHGYFEGPVASIDTLNYPGRVIPRDEVGTDPLRASFPESVAVLMRKRLRDDYVRNPGHTYGSELDDEEGTALISSGRPRASRE